MKNEKLLEDDASPHGLMRCHCIELLGVSLSCLSFLKSGLNTFSKLISNAWTPWILLTKPTMWKELQVCPTAHGKGYFSILAFNAGRWHCPCSLITEHPDFPRLLWKLN